MRFATLDSSTDPVKVVLVGAGAMGQHWLSVLQASADVELVGLVDLDLALANKVKGDAGLASLVVGSSVAAVAAESGAQAVVNVTVPVAHYAVNTEAMFAGLPVLCEKPIAPSVSQTLALAAAAEASGQLLMASQSRRYYRTLAQFRQTIESLGQVGIVTTDFYRGPHFGGFRDTMEQPLLLDMAIHAFDVARYLLGVEPVSVNCDTFNPGWSWYAGDAAAIATFEFEGGLRYLFNGSWCRPGFETSWNGDWRVSGAEGTAVWDGENAPRLEGEEGAALGSVPAPAESLAQEISGSLAEFISALRTGDMPSGEVHSNALSVAMVEGAVRSADEGRRIVIADLLEDAYAVALKQTADERVTTALAGWGSAAAGIASA